MKPREIYRDQAVPGIPSPVPGGPLIGPDVFVSGSTIWQDISRLMWLERELLIEPMLVAYAIVIDNGEESSVFQLAPTSTSEEELTLIKLNHKVR